MDPVNEVGGKIAPYSQRLFKKVKNILADVSGSYNWSLCPTTFPFPTDPGSRESKAWMSNDQWEFQPVNSMSGLAVTGCRCNCSFGLEAPRWTSIGILLGFMGIYSHFLPPQSPWPAVQTIGQSVMGFCASPSQLSGKKRLINHTSIVEWLMVQVSSVFHQVQFWELGNSFFRR